jgi:hypothetical protein
MHRTKPQNSKLQALCWPEAPQQPGMQLILLLLHCQQRQLRHTTPLNRCFQMRLAVQGARCSAAAAAAAAAHTTSVAATAGLCCNYCPWLQHLLKLRQDLAAAAACCCCCCRCCSVCCLLLLYAATAVSASRASSGSGRSTQRPLSLINWTRASHACTQQGSTMNPPHKQLHTIIDVVVMTW